jgi:predicted ATP-dependent serine protease
MKKQALRCAVCQRRRGDVCGGFCECGAYVWEIIPHEAPPGITIESLEHRTSALRPVQFPAILSQALGGVVLGLKMLVGGVPGAGKSTLCAELAAQIAEKLNGEAYWLDGEQNKHLVAELFARTSSPLHRVKLISRRGERGKRADWRNALKAVPPEASIMVVDSLQRWAGRMLEQTAMLEEIATMPQTALIVSHFNKAGQFAGRIGNEYDVDATVIVRPKAVEVTKCRWTLCPRVVPRPAMTTDQIAVGNSKTKGGNA